MLTLDRASRYPTERKSRHAAKAVLRRARRVGTQDSLSSKGLFWQLVFRRSKRHMSMKKVAVFGNAGGGKSTLSRRLAEITDLPLYVLDIVQFHNGIYRQDGKDGGKLSTEEYVSIHREILNQDEWIIDGAIRKSARRFGERIAAADTLIYIDLPIPCCTIGGYEALRYGSVPKSHGLARRTAQSGEKHARLLPG